MTPIQKYTKEIHKEQKLVVGKNRFIVIEKLLVITNVFQSTTQFDVIIPCRAFLQYLMKRDDVILCRHCKPNWLTRNKQTRSD